LEKRGENFSFLYILHTAKPTLIINNNIRESVWSKYLISHNCLFLLLLWRTAYRTGTCCITDSEARNRLSFPELNGF
jgi:hypothetical protein